MNKLEALVVKLGMASEGKTSEIATKVKDLQNAVAKMSPMQLNEFITGLFNKVFKSYIYERTIFKHPLLSKFVTEGTSFEAHREYFDSKLIESEDYDINKRMLSEIKTTKTLSTILSTQLKKVMSLTINLNFAKAAFASETAFSQWLENQFRVLEESVNIELYNKIGSDIVKGVKNVIDLTSVTKYDTLLQEINTLSDNMFFPSEAYNLGYQSEGTGIKRIKTNDANAQLRKNSLKREDMLLFVSPKIKNLLDSKVSSIKFHNQYFDITKYTVVTLDENLLKEGENDIMLLIDKNAFKGYFRVNEMASQFWAANLLSDYHFHYWLVFGEIPWANGVKIKLSNKFVD